MQPGLDSAAMSRSRGFGLLRVFLYNVCSLVHHGRLTDIVTILDADFLILKDMTNAFLRSAGDERCASFGELVVPHDRCYSYSALTSRLSE